MTEGISIYNAFYLCREKTVIMTTNDRQDGGWEEAEKMAAHTQLQ